MHLPHLAPSSTRNLRIDRHKSLVIVVRNSYPRPSTLVSCLTRGNRLNVKDSTEEVLNNLGLALLAGLLDTLDLLLGVAVGFVLGLFITLAVLYR